VRSLGLTCEHSKNTRHSSEGWNLIFFFRRVNKAAAKEVGFQLSLE